MSHHCAKSKSVVALAIFANDKVDIKVRHYLVLSFCHMKLSKKVCKIKHSYLFYLTKPTKKMIIFIKKIDHYLL